jgi:tetratricopeptide (TPR) repeat protein
MSATPPASRLVARLDAAIARAVHPVDAACLRAERAGHLARQGHFDEAGRDIAALHAEFRQQPNAAVSAWLCLAEGLTAYFSNMSAVSRDKIQRAHALSAAARIRPLQALSTAWLAHMDYVALDVERMARNVTEALQTVASDNHSAQARACLVMGLALHFAERLDLAQPWYAKVREHALADGDEATLSALIHNIAWHRGNHAMQSTIFGGNASEHARHAMAGAVSTDNFDQWIGATSLDALVPMLRAVVFSVQGEFERALTLYEVHLADARTQGLGRMSANFLADMAWCRWHGGDAEGARDDAASAASSIEPSMHADDRAVAHGRLGQLLRAMGDIDAALPHEQQARECWTAHRRLQAQVVELLTPLNAAYLPPVAAKAAAKPKKRS